MPTFIPFFFILVGCLTFLCGCMVRFRRKLELLALYDAEATTDKKGLARWAGSMLMVIAIIQACCGIAGLWLGNLVWTGIAFVGFSLFFTIVLALGTGEYSKHSIR